MASTPSHRLRLTPSSSPFLPRPSRSPNRGRAPQRYDSRLCLKRVIGTTCVSPTGFDAVRSSFAYIAGGAVVVVDVDGSGHGQRFFRARPTAVPVFTTPAIAYSSSTPSTPKANDSRNRTSVRESTFGPNDWAESPTSKTWTSRERIKAATCLALSKEGRFLAVGETGYAPRVLIYSLEDCSSDTPLVSISEHTYGVKAVAWSADSKFLASLGASNDGFLYVWRIDPRTGAAKLFQQNRCTTYIKGMIWVGNNLVTLGVRHVKVWRVDEAQTASPVKQKFIGDVNPAAQSQKTLPGRNVLLGNMIEATFSCAAAIDDTKAIICSETGDVCLLEDVGKQIKLVHILESGFVITCVGIRNGLVYIGGKSGDFATLDLDSFLGGSPACIRTTTEASANAGVLALGFLEDKMVTVDSKRSIDIWNQDHVGGAPRSKSASILIPGRGDAVMGIGSLSPSNVTGAQFYTWSQLGHVILWSSDGTILSSFQVPLDEAYFDEESELVNQMITIRATMDGKYFIAGDKLGFVKVVDFATKRCVSSMKAHASDCQYIATYEDNSTLLVASCGRDRTAQLFHQLKNGDFEHFQTLEFAARVSQVLIPSTDKVITCSLDRTVQIHDLVAKEGDPDVRAAISSRTLSLKASPTSMAMGPDGKTLFVSQVERSVYMFDLDTGKPISSFKCFDENGADPVILDSLTPRPATEKEPAFLLGLSNTDKSIRMYDTQGHFLAREWGHTEAIHGVAVIEGDDGDRKVVSVGSDGTIMIWDIDLQDRGWGSISRESSPVKDATTPVNQPILRRVLSKTELAEFQRPLSSAGGRRSPPRSLTKRRSLYLGNLSSTPTTKTPTSAQPSTPAAIIAEDTPSRRRPGTPSASPPISPKSKGGRRPSVPTLNSTKTKSNNNLRSFGSLNMSTEQTCRTLRAYRKKLASSDPISQDTLAALDQELRLTAVALGDRAKRSKAISDTLLHGLLDQYSERLVSLLDEKLRLGKYRRPSDQDTDSTDKRPGSSGTGSSNAST
ncbi:putative WD domain-containing protein [Rosellinia necatrix]|uniref:Putative WD domain-containing protein n=1 Tax=Rosellinia necatrix TaxID=77044 RepID=A0A1S7UKI8_ROSNE|nr:putative WD domain-containing protein [Rosellinia necatrix]